MVKKSYMKTATILFYVCPSIDACIKNAQTIDLMEGGKEQAQNVPNSEINRWDEDGKEGHADGSSRDVPIQTDSEGAKKTVDMCVNGEEGKADDSSGKDDKMDGEEEEEESGEVDSSSGEESESSSPVVVRPCPRLPPRNQKVLTSKDSSGSSSYFSDLDDEEEEGESGEVDSSSGKDSSSPAVFHPRPRRPRRNPKVLTSKDSSGSSSDSSDSCSSGSSSDSSDSS